MVAVQPSFESLGASLIDTTFVVLDLETTGLSPERDRITEVGAVKVRGGEVLGELATLVHPGRSIPPAVTAVTGITDHMVRGAPPIEAVLPSLLEFLGDAVMVAHNAGFDLSFLRAAAARLDHVWPEPIVVDTARLARRLLREEVRDVRLATLARHLKARTRPEHRALADSRATVDVLHGLLERAGAYGATTLEDLRDLARSTSEKAYRRVGLVRDAPATCGVYRFVDADERVLYVGKATDLRRRLRTYFGQDPRRRVADLVRETARVDWTVTPTLLEAEVREVRAIQRLRPRYNRRSKHPDRQVYITLTTDAFPRLSVVSQPPTDRALVLGPLASRRTATQVLDAIHEVMPLRTCTARLRRAQDHSPCIRKDLGLCGAPCDGSQTTEAYAEVVASFLAAVEDARGLLAPLRQRMLEFAERGRFERAGEVRSRLHLLARTLADARRLQALVTTEEIVAARHDGQGTDVVVVRRGRLAGTARLASDAGDTEVMAAAGQLSLDLTAAGDAAEDVAEQRLVLAWLLEAPGVRLMRATDGFAEPCRGGAALAGVLAEARRVDRQVRRDRQVLSASKVVQRAAG